MKLSELLQGIRVRRVTGETNREIAGLAYHSGSVKPGFLFFAVRGFHVDGNRFVGDALQRGAAAVLSERSSSDAGATWVQVVNDRAAMAGIAANFYSHPSRKITLVGVTGTNGKTTTTFLLDAIFRAFGSKTALMGTIEQRIGGEVHGVEHTTPESPDAQQFLRRAVDAGCQFASMEVSSHALQLRRCDALQFRGAVFTNLTRDHLDFHGTFENYYRAKLRFFTDATFGEPDCVINRDNPYGERLWNEVLLRKVSYGLDPRNEFHPRELECGPSGTSFQLEGRGKISIRSALLGLPNVYNILAACAAALQVGVPEEAISQGVDAMRSVPGRMERIPNKRGLTVLVDFAHTDDALKNLLQAARAFTRGKLIVLFGCGGDRDRTKRPIMGKVAAELADFVVLTSDNPRREDPAIILDEIEQGLRAASTPYVRIQDRRDAIRYAISRAHENDMVILAGKGHEDYQIIGTQKMPFSDRDEARRVLEAEP